MRSPLLDLLPAPPTRFLDVGCAAGTTAAEAKSRWPECTTIGIELVPEVAERARRRVDRVIVGSAETLDFAAVELGGVDAVLLADVLEHLLDPWAFLRRLRAALVPHAAIVASIPNLANFWLLEELAAGRFPYADSGLLDRTHLRFFTRASIAAMFEGAGFAIERWERVTDGRVDALVHHRLLGVMLPERLGGRVRGQRVTLTGIDAQRFEDLRTLQFMVVARPA